MKVSAAPCLIVRPSETVRSTIESMQKSQSNYVLVCNDIGECVGIFTDKDVLTRFFELQNENLLRPITAYMTSPVVMLQLSKMDDAPKIMRERNIRHVPIFQTEGNRHHILGIVTLKKLVAENLLTHDLDATIVPQSEATQSIATMATDTKLDALLRSIFPTSKTSIQHLSHANWPQQRDLESSLAAIDVLVFDIDDIPETTWKRILSSLNSLSQPLPVILCLTPSHHSMQILEILKKLKGASWIQVFEKPLDLVALRVAIAAAGT